MGIDNRFTGRFGHLFRGQSGLEVRADATYDSCLVSASADRWDAGDQKHQQDVCDTLKVS